jgi:4'-phosphopantetheinyl transferase
MHLTSITLTDLRESGLEKSLLIQLLPSESKGRLLGKSNTDNHDRSLLGELLARYSLKQFKGVTDVRKPFTIGSKGKPHLDGFPGIHFNISHSGGMIVCAVASSSIGVDVEHDRKVNFRVAERFFSPAEINDLFSLPESERQAYFFQLWTIKESFLKTIGSGLTRTLNSFTVKRSDQGFRLAGDEVSEALNVKTYQIPGYYLAVCNDCQDFPQSIKSVSIKEIVDLLA